MSEIDGLLKLKYIKLSTIGLKTHPINLSNGCQTRRIYFWATIAQCGVRAAGL